MGGIRPTATRSINLNDRDNFPTLDLDVFMCERRSVNSALTILLEASSVYCKYKDKCGMCNGNGQSCCDSEQVIYLLFIYFKRYVLILKTVQ